MQRIEEKRPVCEACGAYAADVLCPVGDGAKPACYMCAHFLTEHAHDVETHGIMGVYDRARAICKCRKDQIYPADVLFERRLAAEDAARACPSLRAAAAEHERLAAAFPV